MAARGVIQSFVAFWSSVAGSIDWSAVKDALNSTFCTSLIGALAGAFAGATAAQRLAERGKAHEELLKEIRNTNAATAIAFGICNNALSLKKQYVKGLKEQYIKQLTELDEFNTKIFTGEIKKGESFWYEANLQLIQPPLLLIDTLQTLMFERLSIIGRPLHTLQALVSSVQTVNDSLTKRNELIEWYKSMYDGDNDGLAPYYFGQYDGKGKINKEYPSVINAIYTSTDNTIFYSHCLGPA